MLFPTRPTPSHKQNRAPPPIHNPHTCNERKFHPSFPNIATSAFSALVISQDGLSTGAHF